MRIVERINTSGKISVVDVSAMFGITRQAALKEINKMLALEIIKREGKARASFYTMR